MKKNKLFFVVLIFGNYSCFSIGSRLSESEKYERLFFHGVQKFLTFAENFFLRHPLVYQKMTDADRRQVIELFNCSKELFLILEKEIRQSPEAEQDPLFPLFHEVGLWNLRLELVERIHQVHS